MRHNTISEINEVLQRFKIGQTLYTVSWDKPELVEYILTSIDIEILSSNYCNIVLTLEHENPSMSTKYSYSSCNEYFFDVKSIAEDKLRKTWNS